MNIQLKGLLNVILSGLYNKPLDMSCEDLDMLYGLAKVHSVGNLFYKAIQDRQDLPDDLKEKAKSHYLGNIQQQILQDYYAEQIFRALNEENIKYMPLKGYYLRKLYPSPELRTSCDIDFFYDVSRTNDLKTIMR